MGNPDWGRWQVIIGVIALVIALAGLIVTYESSTFISNNNDNNNNINISNIDNNKILTETAKSTPSTSFIIVSSSPTGASIYLDGKYEGEASQVLSNIESGTHLITLKLAGYEDWSQDISVDANKTISISPTLTPTEVSTDISTTNTATGVETPTEEDYRTVVETPTNTETENNESVEYLKIDNLSHVTWSYNTSKSSLGLNEGETLVDVTVYIKSSNDVIISTLPEYWKFFSDEEEYSSEDFLSLQYGNPTCRIATGCRSDFHVVYIIQGEPKNVKLVYRPD